MIDQADRIKLIVVLGPTASGKTGLSIELASALGAEIVSADSMQVYRYMDIGTAKPTARLRRMVPHHLIDVAFPSEQYTAARYRTEAARAVREIVSRGKRVVVTGGTGLYIRALTEGLFKGPGGDEELRRRLTEEAAIKGRSFVHSKLEEVDPEAAGRIHPNNLHRTVRALEVYLTTNRPISEFQKEHAFGDSRYDALKVGITWDRKRLGCEIDKRVERMVDEGLVEETSALLKRGYSPELQALKALGYKETVRYLCGDCPLDEAIALIKKNTRNYAKRQMTWFNRDGDVKWFNPEDKAGIMALAKEHFN